MLHFPNAKINLGLYVTGKRPDGYHDLETIFYPLRQVKDALEVVASPGDETTMRISGKAIEGDPGQNLVWKAYKLLQARYPDRIPALQIHLQKTIPMGAGLGGGSADGAFMLRLINTFCGLELSDSELAAMALQLGSDCPFFIYNTPQLAAGRGELLSPLSLDLSAYSIQLVCPRVPVATATAFKHIIPAPAPFDLGGLPQLPVSSWKDVLYNQFEASVFAGQDYLRQLKEQLYAGGALYAAMSGSGSALFGIFPKDRQAEAISTNELQEVFYCA